MSQDNDVSNCCFIDFFALVDCSHCSWHMIVICCTSTGHQFLAISHYAGIEIWFTKRALNKMPFRLRRDYENYLALLETYPQSVSIPLACDCGCRYVIHMHCAKL